jgi:menaquinone-dependent protoporphyrinogen oxidase
MHIKRRDFIKIFGVVIGSAILGKYILSYQTSEAANDQFPESNCGDEKKGGKKILVVYVSQYGTTAEVAEAIGKVLCQEGNTVETKLVKNVKTLDDYDAVIIGSAIQYDEWMPEASEFVIAHQNILEKLPVAYFFTCLVLSVQNEKVQQKAMEYSDKLYALAPQVNPVDVRGFAGVLDYNKLSFIFGLIFKSIFSILGVQEGDFRDWVAIRAWAKCMHSKLADEIESSNKGIFSG